MMDRRKLKGFKPIPGFPHYVIDKKGEILRIRSHYRLSLGRVFPMRVKLLQAKSGHYFVRLQGERKTRPKTLPLHRILLMTWVGMPPTPKHQAHHKDHNPENNSLENICWVTPQENIRAYWESPKGQERLNSGVVYLCSKCGKRSYSKA